MYILNINQISQYNVPIIIIITVLIIVILESAKFIQKKNRPYK